MNNHWKIMQKKLYKYFFIHFIFNSYTNLSQKWGFESIVYMFRDIDKKQNGI